MIIENRLHADPRRKEPTYLEREDEERDPQEQAEPVNLEGVVEAE